MEDHKLKFRIEKNKTKYDIVNRSEELGLSLRKNKLDNIISSKRNINLVNENIEYKINAEEIDLSNDLITLNDLEDIKKLKDPFLTKGLYSENEKFLKFSLFFIRKYLSSPNPNSKEVIKEFVLYQIDIIDILCELILKSNKKIQYEASWILINLCSYFSDPVNRIINREKNFKNLLSFMLIDDYVLLEHGVWIINNICVDSGESFDLIIKSGIEQRIREMFKYSISLQFTKILIFFYKNLHKFKKNSGLEFSLSPNELTNIINIFVNSISDELTNECLDYFYYLSLDNLVIDKIQSEELIHKFFNLALIESHNEDENKNKMRSITVVGNLLCGSVVQTHKLINIGLLEILFKLLDSKDIKIIKEVIFSISNVATSPLHIQLIKNKGIIDKILIKFKLFLTEKSIEIVEESYEYTTLKELIYCICNCLDEGDISIKGFFLEYDPQILAYLIICLKIYCKNPDIIFTILRSLSILIQLDNENLLNRNYNINQKLIYNGILNLLPQFLMSKNESIKKYAEFIDLKLSLKEDNNINITIEN